MNIEIGRKICELRKSRDMTQEALASEMGVSIAAVSKWETGNSIPDIYMVCSIADFFNVSTDELLGRASNKKKVIIADDVAFMRDNLRELLTENGCAVVGAAADGDELLSLLQKQKVDIVTLDINMPGMDGITALEHIRKEFPDIKVIMISAVTDQAVVDAVIALGASAYVTKPFRPEAITSILHMLR